MNKIAVDKSQMQMLSRELGKLQSWLTGYHAGAGHKPNQLGIHIPGEDAVRQTKLLFRDMIQAVEAAVAEPDTVAEEDEEGGWIPHNGLDIPCDGKMLVDIRFRDSTEAYNSLACDWHASNPESSHWVSEGCHYDIVAWRPAK